MISDSNLTKFTSLLSEVPIADVLKWPKEVARFISLEITAQPVKILIQI